MNKLKKIFLTAVATLTVATVSAAGEEPAAESYRNNRHPLLQKDYIQLPLGTIRAEGWMHDQLTHYFRVDLIQVAGHSVAHTGQLVVHPPFGADGSERQRISFRAWELPRGCVHLSFITENRNLRFIRLP